MSASYPMPHAMMCAMLPLVALLVAAVPDPEPAAPAPLACLARHYAVTPERDGDGRWWGRLPDGARVPYDDGRAKSFDEKLDAPDLEDMFALRYRAGAI